jgi:predicted ATPase
VRRASYNRRGVEPARRDVFVGRDAELAQLHAAFDAAATGHASLIVVAGEPGIGKTALCEQLTQYVDGHAGRTLVGHCYAEGSLSVPYLPFVEALRAYVLQRDATSLDGELGAGAADLARILPELLDLLHVEPLPPESPEDARWRLLQSVSAFVRAASLHQPLLLVLEDVHDADRGTLDLLVHLSRNLAGARLLVLATYRDVEVDRAHPLSAALGELRRSPDFARVSLRGLGAADVHRLCSLSGAEKISWTRADVIYRRTEGNPLFVREVLRNAADGFDQATIPEGLRDAVGKTLGRLSASCNALLSNTAVIGPDFDLSILQAVAGMNEEALIVALEEAVRAGLLYEQVQPGSIRYRFTHAFFRQTLYEELIAPRRLRLHQRVARALEARYAGRLDEHAAEVAEHFSHSTDPDDLRKSIDYYELAARRAVSVYAHGEAARILERALQVHDALDAEDSAIRCDLLLELGNTLIPAGEPRRAAEEIAPAAWDLAQNRSDTRRASRAAQLALEALTRHGGAPAERTDAFRQWAARADRYADPDTLERVYADLALGAHLAQFGDQLEPCRLIDRALALAWRLGEPEALFRSAAYIMLYTDTPSRGDLRLAVIDEVAAHSRERVSQATLGTFLSLAQKCYVQQGNRHRFDEIGRELATLAGNTRNVGVIWRPLAWELIRNTLDGKLEDALAIAAKLVSVSEELGVGVLGRVHAYPWSARARWCLGVYSDPDVEAFIAQTGWAALSEAPLAVTRGQRELAWTLVRAYAADLSSRGDAAAGQLFDLVPALEAALMLDDRELIEVLVHQLKPAGNLVGGPGMGFTSIARLLGKAAFVAGDRQAARLYFEQGLKVCEHLGYRPEAALIRLELAELFLSERESAARSNAVLNLDIAISEMTDMHMLPHLERALALQRQIGPALAHAAHVLSPREREVAALVGQGLSNRAIAEALVISEATAEVHVKRILNKLGFRSRAQIAVWTIESVSFTTTIRPGGHHDH